MDLIQGGLFEHEAGEGDQEAQACECLGQAFVVTDEAAEACGPGEGAPTLRKPFVRSPSVVKRGSRGPVVRGSGVEVV